MHRQRLFLLPALALSCALGLGLAAPSARAQAYPTKSIRVINPWGAGGASDAFVRPIMQKLSEVFGQAVLIENQPGASGMIGAATVARAAPDGYTLLVANVGPTVISPALEPKMAYDSLKDFAPITQLVSAPQALIVRSDLPIKNVADLVAYGKAHPKKLTYGSVGPGTPTHLGFEILSQMAGGEYLQVPYKGSAQVMTDLVGGQVDMAFTNIAGAIPLMHNPKLRVIAVSTLKRSSGMPDVPAVSETVPGYDLNAWWGLMAPAGTPKAVVNRLQQEIAKIMRAKDMEQRLREMGLEVEASTPEQFDALVHSDMVRWAGIVKARNIKLD
jgi:tripartite-type tricarboxylate transporter receptor subunit TctC